MAELKDIKKLVDELEKFNKKIIEAGDNSDKLVPIIKELNDAVAKLNKTTGDETDNQEKLNAVQKEAQKIVQQLETTEAKIATARTAQNKTLQEKKIQLSEINKQIKEDIKLSKAQENSIARLNARNKELRDSIKLLDLTKTENIETIKKYNKEIDENNKKIKENSDKFLQAKQNVGNYEESIRAALEGTNAFSGGATNVINNFIQISQQEGGVRGFFQTFVGGIGSATKAGLKFIATPIGAVIAAIVTVIGLFTSAIKRNQGASDTFSKVWAGITNVIDELIGRFFRLGGVVSDLFKGNFKKAGQGLKETFTGVGESIQFAFNEGQKLRALQIELEKSTIKATSEIAKLNAESEKQQTIADDNTRSFKEREQAAELARTATAKAANENLALASKELEIINERVKQAERQGKINRELEQQQADALAGFIEAEGELTRVTLENEKLRSELKQDRLERDLDILIDGFDNVKTINERIIADDKRSFNERQQLLFATQKLSDDSFNKQIETIRKFTKIQFDENELLAEQDAVILNEKIRSLGLSEIIEGRLLEIIRDRRTATQDLAEAQRDLNDTFVQIEEDTLDLLEIDKQIRDEARKEQEARDKKALEDFKVFQDEKTRILEESEQRRAELIKSTSDSVFSVLSAANQRRLQDDSLTEEERKKIERRGLLLDIGKSLFDIGLQTAKSVFSIQAQAAVLAANPITAALAPLALAQIPRVIAGGAIAAGTVAALKIPQFAGGVENFSGGLAIVGEKGRELIQTPRGEVFLANNPALVNLERGSNVITNSKTEAILNDRNMVKELRLTRKAIVHGNRTESQFTKRQRGYRDGYLSMQNRIN